MKKISLFIILLLSIFTFNNEVSADITYKYSSYYDNYEEIINYYNQYKSEVDKLMNVYTDNYQENYPYYGIASFYNESSNLFYLSIIFDDEKLFYNPSHFSDGLIDINIYHKNVSEDIYPYWIKPFPYQIECSIDTNTCTELGFSNISINNYTLLYANHDIYFSDNLYYDDVSRVDKVLFPSYESTLLGVSYPEIEITTEDIWPTYLSLYDGTYDISIPIENMTEVNLNNYSYIILVPKYDLITSSSDFNLYYKGSYCLTPVANYGRTPYSEYWGNCVTSDSKFDANDSDGLIHANTLYIDDNSIANMEVFYIKPKYTNEENLFYYDSEYFDIVYMTDEITYPIINTPNGDVEGKRHRDLPQTSYSNDEDGIISGTVEEFTLKTLWNNLKKGIYNGFVPSDGFFEEWFNEIHIFLTDKLGILYYPFDLLINLFNRIINISDTGTGIIEIPEIKDPFYHQTLIKPTTLDLKEIFTTNELGNVHSLYLTVVDFILYIALANLCYNKFVELIKGYGSHADEDSIYLGDSYEPKHIYHPKHGGGSH